MSETPNTHQPAQKGPSPWIERVILSYGGPEGNSRSQLDSHVLAVGPMSQSQAQGCNSPTCLVFLSDGVLQIPALLTASAWEHLSTHQDRDAFKSLLNTAVHIREYQLQFYMVPELTKCRFYLAIKELTVNAARPPKHSIPSCTTLSSIRHKIYDTWKSLKGQGVKYSQRSQFGLDLSKVLGEWHHDHIQDILDDVQERMMDSSRPVHPQPSTSTSTSRLTHLDTSTTTTSWDVDRLRDKRVKCFRVPIKCLLIPEEDAQQLITAPNVGRKPPNHAGFEDRKTDSPHMCTSSGGVQPSVDHAERHKAKPGVEEIAGKSNENSTPLLEDDMSYDNMILRLRDMDIRPLSNPWDIFPPPGYSSSSSDASPEATPSHSLQNPIGFESEASETANIQPRAHCSKELCGSSEHSFLPPYQKQPHSSDRLTAAGSSSSTSVSLLGPFTRLTATDELCPNTTNQNLLNLNQEKKKVEKKSGKAKRKRCDSTPERIINKVVEEEEEAVIIRSPPSWLFDSHSGSSSREHSLHQQGRVAGRILRKPPTVHSDGSPFSYSYHVSGQILWDFSDFSVADSLLHWAVKYLVAPQQTDDPHKTSSQTQLSAGAKCS